MHGDTAFDEADLNAYVDGRIEPYRGAALAASLASDPEAAGRIAAWRRQNDSLRTMFASVLFEPVPVRLMPVAVSPRGGPPARRTAARRGGRLGGALATASVGMALVGFAIGALASVGTDGFGLSPTRTHQPGATGEIPSDGRDLAARAAEAHRTFLTDPVHAVEVTAGDEPRLSRWLGRRIGAALRAPNLSRQGWTLLGGRIVPGRHGPAAFLAYGCGGDRLGLIVARGAGQGETRVVAADDDTPSLGVATWGDGEFGYALTSDRGREWLNRNLGPLRDGVKAQARAAAADDLAPQP